MKDKFQHGDKIRLGTGETGIFEEYDEANKKKCFVIIDPDLDAQGSTLVNISDIRRRI